MQTEVPHATDPVQDLLLACRRQILEGAARAPLGPLVVRFLAHGKMLRARLVFLAASAVEGAPLRAMPAAIAIELLHAASLVHDDIIDDEHERRGLPALHRQVGVEVALTLGDYFVLRAFSELLTASPQHPPEQVLAVIRDLSLYGQECCEGQVLELVGTTDSEDEYSTMVQAKTGSLFAAAVTLGGTLGGGTSEEIEALRAFGESLGRAFQVQDDVEEFLRETDGAAPASNGARRRQPPSLPRILLKQYGSVASLREYDRLRSTGSSREMSVLLRREGIWQRVAALQDSHISAARNALHELEPSAATRGLRAIAEACRCGV